ncbi:hypothetical protein PPERSA_08680 [Pseudocohnilembus persalinus]|uniref:Uncharacterized protein n=1 Tax=Pseudocohnilembus persalinus TaxID=266149 RepID=A0A0V0R865_PSEPJ|nr:hypothetical protein PPERSA_08680 [Pseudocohnilembus persalinus]|eukprot:KRX10685.1 hypothetical protein PPERSA_08680 [Pseudocohnilembus persalinus]
MSPNIPKIENKTFTDVTKIDEQDFQESQNLFSKKGSLCTEQFEELSLTNNKEKSKTFTKIQNEDNQQNQQELENDEIVYLYQPQYEQELYIQLMQWMLESNQYLYMFDLKQDHEKVNLLDPEQNEVQNEFKAENQQKKSLKNKLKIQNPIFLLPIMSFYGISSHSQQIKILEHLLLISQTFTYNCQQMNNQFEFKFWLFDLILESQFILKSASSQNQQKLEFYKESQQLALKIVKQMSQELLLHDSEGFQIVQFLKIWTISRKDTFYQTQFQELIQY